MLTYVLPNIMTVDDVNNVSDEFLKLLSNISTGIVLKTVNDFVNKNINSPIQANADAAAKLQEAYRSVNEIQEYLNSNEAKNLADTLVSLQYSDVSASTDIAKLKYWRMLIIELLSEDEDFMKSYTSAVGNVSNVGYKTAYTARLDKDNLQTTLEAMEELAVEDMTAAKLVGNIKKMKNLFKNGNHNINKPTVLRKAIYSKDRLKTILRGLDFLIPRLESNVSPATWRRL